MCEDEKQMSYLLLSRAEEFDHYNSKLGGTKMKKVMNYLLGMTLISMVILTGCRGQGDEYTINGATYLEEEVVIGEGSDWPLDGILTLPAEASAENPVPVVILVHGSGPGDRDQSIFENRPFFDIADYLSENGIAVLRYDKRTLTHGEELLTVYGGELTVMEETIEDVLLATELIRADERINEEQVFVLGLSLGGILAPRIYTSAEGSFAGLVIMAGTPRDLTEVMMTQNEMMLDEMEEGAERNAMLIQIEQIGAIFDSIPTMTPEVAREMDLGGMSAYYFLDMILNPFSLDLAEVEAPILALQGEQDFQILADLDFVLMEELLADCDNAQTILYPGLNHLFMPSEIATGISNIMDEYAIPAQVDEQVLRDIVQWIFEQIE